MYTGFISRSLITVKIPYIHAVLRVGLLPFGFSGVAETAFPVPPGRAGNLLFLQPAPDVVRAVPLHGHFENVPDDGCGLLIDQQMPVLIRIFPVAQRSDTPGEAAPACGNHVGRMHLLGDIPRIHLVEYVLEGCDLVALGLGVDAVVQGDVPDTMSGEEILDQVASLQIVPAQTAEVLCDDQVDPAQLDVPQEFLQTGPVHVQAGEAIVLVNLNNVPALSFADGCQKLPLVADAGALTLEIIILGEPAIDANSKQPRRWSVGDLISARSVHHGDSPHNPDKP